MPCSRLRGRDRSMSWPHRRFRSPESGFPVGRSEEHTSELQSPMFPYTTLFRSTITDAGQQKIEELRWIDERGESLKSVVPSLGQQSVHTTKANALQPAAGTRPLDVMAASTIPITGKRIPSGEIGRAHV